MYRNAWGQTSQKQAETYSPPHTVHSKLVITRMSPSPLHHLLGLPCTNYFQDVLEKRFGQKFLP
jgi:hypothetical protein